MYKKNNTLQGITLAAALALTIVALSGGWVRNSLASHPKSLFDDPDSPVTGNPKGGVTLIEFFDYHCVVCKSVLKVVMTVLEDEPDVRLIFKEYPILGRESVVAARAALAANAQDPRKYVPFHIAMMSSRGLLTEPRILRLARGVGLDPERLKTAMFAPEILQAIKRNWDLADALGIRGTPAFVIGDKVIPGAVSLKALKRYIAEARADLGGKQFSARAIALQRGRLRL
ncbi:MAG: DsbA family protein [Proteobacteria bacterium]|nr:DsbA family protein [Pseudomonadota bacterium]